MRLADPRRTLAGEGRLASGFCNGLLVVALLAITLGATGAACSRRATAAGRARASSPNFYEPEFALAFSGGGEGPTGRALGKARELLRPRPAAARPYADFALLLLRRKRETADPTYVALAEDALRAAASRGPDDPSVLAVQGMIAQEGHRFAAAREVGRRLTDLRPHDPTGPLLLGDALLELGAYDGAVDAYQQAVDRRPELRGYNRAAHVRWLHGDVDGALEMIGLALDAGSANDPESTAWCTVDLAQMLLQRGRAGAIAAFEAAEGALRLVPEYLPALSTKARALGALGRRVEAIAVLERVVPRSPGLEDALALADLYAAEGRVADAQARANEAARRGRDDPRAMALYLARHDLDHEGALALAGLEIAARPGNIYSLDVQALALARAGRLDEARAKMTQALALGTPDARFWLHHALIDALLHDPAAARRSLARANTTNPAADPLLSDEIERRLGRSSVRSAAR